MASTIDGIYGLSLVNGLVVTTIDNSTGTTIFSSSSGDINITASAGYKVNLSNTSISGPLVLSGSPGTAGQVATSQGAGLPPVWGAGPTAGTVTSFTFTNANGFVGSVANTTTTPNLTLSTSVSGLLYGSSNALTSATGSQVVAVIGSTPVQAANAIDNTAGWAVTPVGSKLVFSYNGGAALASLDSTGQFIVLGDVIANGTP